eukprot:m.208554 g.208554  ORF g.208554 m.208554 type:complete len:202 (-) comp18536_c2_seq2:343-948(-)
MGGCISTLVRFVKKQHHLRRRKASGASSRRGAGKQYTQLEDEIEIQTLIDRLDSDSEDEIPPDARRPMTEEELQRNTRQKFADIVAEQERLDAELDAQLAQQRQDLQLEEEVYASERKAAAQAAKQHVAASDADGDDVPSSVLKDVDQWSLGQTSLDRVSISSVNATTPGTPTSDDFEAFLADVRASTLGVTPKERALVAT